MRRIAHVISILLACASCVAAGPAAAQTPPRAKTDELARARALDKEGARAYGEGRYNDAIRYFEEAYRLGGPSFELWNIAKCHLRLDQAEQAAEMFERYLTTPNLPKEDRDEATQQLDALKKRPSTLTVSSSPSGAQVSLDGKPVDGQTPLSIAIAPGVHTVSVSSPTSVTYTNQVEAKYGHAVIVDAQLADTGAASASVANPDATAPVVLRAGISVVLPRYGTLGGRAGPGVLALGTYRITQVSRTTIAVGGLFSVSGDSWDNRTGAPNQAPGCPPMSRAQSATALSFFALGTASYPITSKLRAVGLGGVGVAGYSADDVGGDLFVPSCTTSPGVRPALLLGAEIDYALSSLVRLSAFPLTWHVQPAFDGTRSVPRDASGIWMRFGIGIGAGVDL